MIGRILAISTVLALTNFLVAVLIGHFWSLYAQQTAALGFSGIYERFQAWQASFSDDPTTYRAAAEAQRAGQGGRVVETVAVEE
jgi:hypothetical protein